MVGDPSGAGSRWSLRLERAIRLATLGHRDQTRKGSGVPYVEHPMAVAMILDRLGFDEDVVIAGLFHDLVEDTEVFLEQIRQGFGDRVAGYVAACTEDKTDGQGRKRPWINRKLEHLEVIQRSGDDVRAVVVADKLHNLISIQLDLLEGRDVWATFNADRSMVLAYYKSMLDACEAADPRVKRLLGECRALLAEIMNTGR